MRKSNYPGGQISALSGTGYVQKTVSSLQKLTALGRPKDEAELRKRIDAYFNICAEKDLRPGIEGLALSLGATRQSFWCWCSGENCSETWAETCRIARQFVIAFIEAASLQGRLNPATSCFVLKNWAGYSDTVVIETETEKPKELLPASMLPILENKDV